VIKPAAGYQGPLAYSSPEAVQTTGTVADIAAFRVPGDRLVKLFEICCLDAFWIQKFGQNRLIKRFT
jgi:hypothetical protein